MSLEALQALVNDLVRDTGGVVSSTSLDAAIDAAVLRYSTDFPRPVVVDVAAPGGNELPLPLGWQDASRLLSVETPIDQLPPAELGLGDVRFRMRPDGMAITLPIALDAGQDVRLGYTQTHVVDNSTDTVPAGHRYALACFAASILCGQLASYYANEGAPTIQADTADHQGKTERYRARARDLAQQYANLLGVADRKITAAGTVTHLQGRDSEGRRRLFHDSRYRR